MLWIILGIVGGIIALVVILMLVMPGHSKVECSIEINAPVDKAYAQVIDLKKWEGWSPWYKMDPNAKREFSDPASGLNAWMKWDSKNKNVSQGKMTITKAEENKHTEQTMEFAKWGTSSADMFFEGNGETSKIRWVMEQDMKGPAKFFKGMIEKMLTKNFNDGLAGIKAQAEKA